MRILINSIEQEQPQHSDEVLIKLFGRRPESPDERIEVTVSGFRPYFYAPEDVTRHSETFLLEQESIEEIEYGDYESLGGDSLAKIYPPYPQDTRDARSYFEDTWEADVPFTRRFRIDTGIRAYAEVPEPDGDSHEVECHVDDVTPTPHGDMSEEPGLSEMVPTVFLDIEVDDRGEGFPEIGEERILSIVGYDTASGETKGFIDLNGRDIHDAFPDGAPESVDELDVRPSEEQMLIAFRSWFSGKDPDLVSGWNSDNFDIPFIIERMENLNKTNPNGLSPCGWSSTDNRGNPRIKGRTCYDLFTAYKKNSFTELRSYSLDDVAEEELGSEKLQFEGGYYDLYKNDPEKFINYNTRDVTLCEEINEEAGVIEFRDVLRREVGVGFGDSFDNKDFVDMMCRRKLDERGVAGPTRPEYGEAPESDYEGAFVFDAYEGVAENVVGIDLASLYPYTMAMLNASPETKSPDGAVEAASGQQFNVGIDGIFKELVDEAISLKSEYKQLRDNAETDEEYEKMATKYASAKTITNSLYGVTGWERFFLYDEAVAEAVTLTGQHVIKKTAEYVEDSGYNVIYGDTDSVYIKFPDGWEQEECLNKAFDLCDELNEYVYPRLAEDMGLQPEDSMWEIEAEAYMATYFQAGKKKRYAYLATWKDGREIENPEPSISGFSSKRSDSSQLTVETEEKIFDAILSGETDTVSTIVFEAAREISQEGADLEKIGIPGGMNKKVTDSPRKGKQENYYAVSSNGEQSYPQDAHPRGVWNTNQITDTMIDSGAKPRRIYIRDKYFEEVQRQIDVLAFEEPGDVSDIRGAFQVDVQRMTDTLLVSPLREILSAIDIDINAAVRGQEQKGLSAFA